MADAAAAASSNKWSSGALVATAAAGAAQRRVSCALLQANCLLCMSGPAGKAALLQHLNLGHFQLS